jgi:hypothetical protein
MKKYLLTLSLLSLARVGFADQGSSMVCNNLDPAAKPANVLLISSPQGLEGVFGAADAQGPREIFDAPVKGQSKISVVYGPFNWTLASEGLSFDTAVLTFDPYGQIAGATFTGANGEAASFGQCVADSDE